MSHDAWDTDASQRLRITAVAAVLAPDHHPIVVPLPDPPPPQPMPGVSAPPVGAGAPVPQPWSEAGRAATERRLHRKKTRRRQLTRFNEELAEMIVRDAAEEDTIAGVLAPIISVAWKAIVLGGAALLYKLQGTRGYSKLELAALIVGAVALGSIIDPLWRLWRGDRGEDRAQASSTAEGTPESVGLTSLSLQRERDERKDV